MVDPNLGHSSMEQILLEKYVFVPISEMTLHCVKAKLNYLSKVNGFMQSGVMNYLIKL